VNIKILACQIIGPAAAGSAGPVPTALLRFKVKVVGGLSLGLGVAFLFSDVAVYRRSEYC